MRPLLLLQYRGSGAFLEFILEELLVRGRTRSLVGFAVRTLETGRFEPVLRGGVDRSFDLLDAPVDIFDRLRQLFSLSRGGKVIQDD
jgi:hypothetical protein